MDDDPDDQEFFVETLHSVSAHAGCYAASNGEEGLLMLIQEKIRPDYIFTDIQMPGMDGHEFIRQIKSMDEYRLIPIIVYSSIYSSDHLRRMRELGVLACYPKSSSQILFEILRQYFGEPGSFSTAASRGQNQYPL